jgi:hypothetical protein
MTVGVPPIGSAEEGAGRDVWSLPLVLRIERTAPPLRRDALGAAAIACLLLLDDPRRWADWRPAVDAWLAARWRKVARRARGAHWSATDALPHVEAVHGGARVRAFPPVQDGQLAPELARLQVSGTELDDDEPPPLPPQRPLAFLQVTPDAPMTTGKAAAQCGHAAMLLAESLPPRELDRWRAAGYPLEVRDASPAQWRWLCRDDRAVIVRDGGLTEIAPGTPTVAARLLTELEE